MEARGISERIKQARLAAGKTQTEVAEFCQFTQPSVQQIESGDRKSISAEFMGQFCKLTNARLDWIYYGTGPMFAYDLPVLSNESKLQKILEAIATLTTQYQLAYGDQAKLITRIYSELVNEPIDDDFLIIARYWAKRFISESKKS